MTQVIEGVKEFFNNSKLNEMKKKLGSLAKACG
jgi:hypothetical protein